MDIKVAGDVARELMKLHGLSDWTFTVDFSKSRFGQCRHRTKTISLSLPLIKLNTDEVVRDTILHEIAHALEPKQGHNRRWQVRALSIGCNGKRCYGDEVVTPPATFTGTCPGCGKTIKRHRRRRIACSRCCAGKFNPNFVFKWVRN